jgi:uracil-DNA glycosylase
MTKPTVQYNKGKSISPVAFMFACPGQKEQQAGRVVAGSTGNNLNLLLSSIAHSSDVSVRALFPSTDRYDYLITNASNIIHYPALDGKSLPLRSEYMKEENIERLCEELKDIQLVIAFGTQAKDVSAAVAAAYGAKNIKQHPSFITSLPHLSFLSLNQISRDVNGNEIMKGDKEGTAKRINVIKERLEKAIKEATNWQTM